MRAFILFLIATSCYCKSESGCDREHQAFYDACLDVDCTAAVIEADASSDTADSICIVSCTCPNSGTAITPEKD